jgi:hypothetical protein
MKLRQLNSKVRAALWGAVLAAAPALPAAAQTAGTASYTGRPIYSEPTTGLQMPPGCSMEPSWRTRLGTSDFEVWVVSCDKVARAWMLRRSLLEMVGANQARLRFQVLDERVWPEESPGESLSVQCVGRARQDNGYVVAGARWRTVLGKGGDIGLAGAASVWRADPASQKFVAVPLAEVECARYPEREAMMRRLQQAPR